jgi:type II secretory pathway component PulF
MAAFHFRAIAPDGKLRTLTPVYGGAEQKKSLDLKMPGFNRGKRRDVLFFTQELFMLLNAGVPPTAQEVMRVTQEF